MKLVYISKAKNKFKNFKEHQHPIWELMLICEGTGIGIIEGDEYALEPGMILLIPPEKRHSIRSDEGIIDFCIGFEGADLFNNMSFSIVRDNQRKDIENLMEYILKEMQQMPENVEQIVESLLLSLLQILAVHKDQTSTIDAVISDLKVKLIENIGNPDLDIGEMIDTFGFSRGYIRRAFHESTGMSPQSWLINQRVEYAKQCFRQYPGIYTIRQVGIMAGYQDPYYFSRIFKKYAGMSPMEFIRSID